MSVLVYIDDQLLDLFPGTTIAFTYQNTLVGSLSTRRANYTNQIRAPYSQNNVRILGFANDIKAKQVYTIRNARIVQNGFDLLNGIVKVIRADGVFKLSFFSGIVEFVDSLGDETIDELITIDSTLRTWNASYIDSRRAATDGIAAPVVSYGQIRNIDSINDFNSTDWRNIERFLGDENSPVGGFAWTIGSGSASVELPFGETEDRSQLLATNVTLFRAIEYTIQLTIARQGSVWPAYVNFYALKSELVTENGLTNFNAPVFLYTKQPTTNPETFSFSFTPSDDFDILCIDCWTILNDADIVLSDISISATLRIGDVYLPSVYYGTIFSSLITEAGYSLEANPSISNYPIYAQLALAYSKDSFEYGKFFRQCREFRAELSEPQEITSVGNVIFDRIVTKDLFGNYNPTTGGYDSNAGTKYEAIQSHDARFFYSHFRCSMVVEVVEGGCIFELSDQAEVYSTFEITNPGIYTVNLAYRNAGNDDKGIRLPNESVQRVLCDPEPGATIRILRGYFTNEDSVVSEIQSTPQFYACEVLPDIKKKDFFKDVLIRFGLVPKQKNKVLFLKSFNDILNDKNGALDWTNKRDKSFDDEIIYDEDTFAQNNYFTYPSNDDFFNPLYAGGNIVSDNVNLPIEETIYESIFNGSFDFTVSSGSDALYCAYIPVFDIPPTEYPEDFDNDPGYRLIAIRDKITNEPDVQYNGNDRSDYKVGNFLLPDQDYLKWEGFLNQAYSLLMEAVKQNKVIERRYYLTEEDIAQVDPFKLIFDSGEYYWLNTIENYVPGKLVKVQLFKVF